MTNNENNLGMAGESGLNQSPMPNEGGAPVSASEQPREGANEAVGDGDEGDLRPEDFSPEQIAELQEKAAKADENWEKYLRATADLDNYKKRAQRERSEAIKYANESLVERLLPIVDNFEAAIAATNAPNANAESVKTGVSMIYTQLKNFLSESGVDEIDAAGQSFDPNLHEAVSQQATADVPEGQVLQQMRKGYKLRDRLIRPAMVVVAQKP